MYSKQNIKWSVFPSKHGRLHPLVSSISSSKSPPHAAATLPRTMSFRSEGTSCRDGPKMSRENTNWCGALLHSMWWYFDHAFQPSIVSLQCPCLCCFSKQQLAKHLTVNGYTHVLFEIQESGPGQIWWTFSQCSWQSLAKTHSAMSRVIFNESNGTIWSNTKDEEKKMHWKTAFHRLRKHEKNSFFNDLIPQWHFLSKGLLLRVIQTGVCITWNGSQNLGHFVIFHSQMSEARKPVPGVSPRRTLFCWRFNHFKLFCWMSLWFSNPTWDSTQKTHWDFIQEALLTGSAGTADTVHIVLRGTGNGERGDKRFPKIFSVTSLGLGD